MTQPYHQDIEHLAREIVKRGDATNTRVKRLQELALAARTVTPGGPEHRKILADSHAISAEVTDLGGPINDLRRVLKKMDAGCDPDDQTFDELLGEHGLMYHRYLLSRSQLIERVTPEMRDLLNWSRNDIIKDIYTSKDDLVFDLEYTSYGETGTITINIPLSVMRCVTVDEREAALKAHLLI